MPVLLHLFNFSLHSGKFPDSWKTAMVRPLPKVTSPKVPSDYRPISILPALSKILERLVHKQVTEYISKHNLCDCFQSGFKKGHSTGTALLKVLDDTRLAMDTKKVTILTLLDFSKAFDSVNFEIVLKTLSSLNFSDSSLSWFRSYLYERKQMVCFNNDNSSLLQLENGVPQGSVLGPLLFSLYINSLPKVLAFSKYHLFADDFQIYSHSSVSDLPNTILNMNKDLQSISYWTKQNHLRINSSKTQTIIIGYPRLLTQIHLSDLPKLSIDGSPISFVKKIKYLGVTLNERLTWTDQVITTCGRVFGALHSLKRLRVFLPTNIRKLLIHSLIFPYFDYCDTILTDITDEMALKLERALNACVRFIFDLRKDDHVSHHFEALSWLRAKDRRNFHLVRLVHRLIHEKNPPYLSDKFIFMDNPNTRSELMLRIPVHRTSIFNNSLTVAGCRAWNSLPIEVRRLTGAGAFRRAVLDRLRD
jgi:hypothetical protein